MYWDADNLPKWIYITGKAGHPDFPKSKNKIIEVLKEIKNSKNDVYINVSSKEPYYKHIIKFAKGGGVSDTKYAKLKSFIENKKYKEAVDYYLYHANITSDFVGSDVWAKLKKENNFKEFEKIYNNDDRVGMHHDSYAKGGGVSKRNYNYIPQDEIDYLMTEYGRKIDGTKLLDGAYAKGKSKAPKVTRTQFEDESFEYANGGGVDTFKAGDQVEFSVPYFESKFDYKGKIVELRGSYAVVEYYEPLNDKTLRTHLDLSRLSKTKFANGGKVGRPVRKKFVLYTNPNNSTSRAYIAVGTDVKDVLRDAREYPGSYSILYQATGTNEDLQKAKSMFSNYSFDSSIEIMATGGVVEKYKVVKVFRKSGRREILEKNLTLEEAKRVVSRYPNSNTSMVIFTKM